MSEQTLALIDPPAERAPRGTLPRLLAGIPAHGALSLGDHLDVHGAPPVYPGPRRMRRSESPLIELIERSGLRGQGGAGFPTGTKLRAVAAQRKRAVVVVNAAEGEPASLKDRTLMQALPHLVLDGAQLAAQAVGADELIVCVCESAPASAEHAARAISERESRRWTASDTARMRAISERASRGGPASDTARMHLTTVPSHYVAGQETALVNYLNGGPALPTFTPPLVFQQGVRRRPTLVANAETLAHVALIARHGPDWFRQLGTPSQPGSTLVTLAGAVAHPGVYEIEHGSSLYSLIDAAGGLAHPAETPAHLAERPTYPTDQPTLSSERPTYPVGGLTDAPGGYRSKPHARYRRELRALLIGGYGGSWIDGRLLSGVALSDEHLAAHSASLGAGVICLLSPNACPIAETVRLTRWMAGQSTGQCGPCVNGLDAIAHSLAEIVAGPIIAAGPITTGRAPANGTQRIARLASLVHRRGACGHPDGVARMVMSAIEAFGPELADHAAHGPCEGCTRPGELPLPTRPSHAIPVGGNSTRRRDPVSRRNAMSRRDTMSRRPSRPARDPVSMQ